MMTLEDLEYHTDQVRGCLEAHRKNITSLTPPMAAHVREVIEALTPRLDELEIQCAKLRAERSLVTF